MKNIFFTAVFLVTLLCVLPARATKGLHFLQLTWHSIVFWPFFSMIIPDNKLPQYPVLASPFSSFWRISSGIIRSKKSSCNLPQCITIIFSLPTSVLVCLNYNKIVGDLWATQVRCLRLRCKHGWFWRLGYWSLDEFLHDLKMAAFYNLL